MIIKENKYKHKNKELDKEQEKMISEISRKKHIVEELNVSGKEVKIKRPLFFLEAKESFFTDGRGDS